MLTDLLHRLRAVVLRGAVEKELDDELRFHLEQETSKYLKSGLSRDEALRRARLAFGGPDQIKEECRQARGLSVLESSVQDIRYTFRGIGRNPVFAIAAVSTLGLGAGATSTVLTLANTFSFAIFRRKGLNKLSLSRLPGDTGRLRVG